MLHITAIRVLIGGVVLLCSACSSIGVKPWERDLTAQEAMRPDGYPIDGEFDDHVYFSKEASSGGRSATGGGCGCN
jgi:hypothetical protein